MSTFSGWLFKLNNYVWKRIYIQVVFQKASSPQDGEEILVISRVVAISWSFEYLKRCSFQFSSKYIILWMPMALLSYAFDYIIFMVQYKLKIMVWLSIKKETLWFGFNSLKSNDLPLSFYLKLRSSTNKQDLNTWTQNYAEIQMGLVRGFLFKACSRLPNFICVELKFNDPKKRKNHSFSLIAVSRGRLWVIKFLY